MINIIKEKERTTIKDYVIDFNLKSDTNSGYRFYARDMRFIPIFDNEMQERNYQICVNNPALYERDEHVQIREYIEPAIGRCVCGREVVLIDQYMGAVSCACGRWYNLFGQSLKSPKYWEEQDL